MRTQRKPIPLVLVLALLALSAPPSRADDFGQRIAAQMPTPCFDAVAPLIVTDILQRDVHGYLKGVGTGLTLSDAWQPGNEHYDAAYELIYGRVVAEEQAHGPLAAIDTKRHIEIGMNRVPASKHAQLTGLLSSPAGRFGWEFLVDRILCEGATRSYERRHVRFRDEQAAVFRKVQERAPTSGKEFEKRLLELPPAEQQAVMEEIMPLTKYVLAQDPGSSAPPNRFGIDGKILVNKLGMDLGGVRPRLAEITQAFTKAQK